MVAYIRRDLVVYVGNAPSVYLDFDAVDINAPANVTVGQVRSASGTYAAPVANSLAANEAAIDASLLDAMTKIDTYVALTNPSTTERLNYEKLIGKCVKQLIRFRLAKLDAAT